jgi:hypothetical protein
MRSGLTALFPFALVVSGAVAEPKCEPPIPPRDEVYIGAIQLLVDATDIDRRIFHVHETVPVSGGKEAVLLYPEWLPGTHAPSGRNRINKVAGLIVRANVLPSAGSETPVRSSPSA